jgi:hypothetical protein
MVLHVLELRKRINKDCNRTVETVGIFSSVEKAKRWTEKSGKETAKGYGMKSGFYACVKHVKDIGGCEGHLEDFWGFSGEKTYLF